MKRKNVIICSTTLIILAIFIIIFYLYPNQYISAMNKQVDWIVNLQTKNGAIRDSDIPSQYAPVKYKVTPYFANIAALAITDKSDKIKYTKKYIEWYFNHLNWPDDKEINGTKLYGTICDYLIDIDGNEFSMNDYDSADAYAATFLSLLWKYYESGGDVNFLKTNEIKIDAIGKTIVSLIDKDGLSFAKPDYQVKYLMDNCEVYKGLLDIGFIFERIFSNKEKASFYFLKADEVKTAIKTNFMNEKEFYISKDLKGFNKANLSEWYPDTVAQIYPTLFGVIEFKDEQTITSYNMINNKWDWANLKASKDFPWVALGYFGARIDESNLPKLFYLNLNEQYLKTKNYSKWNSLESAWFINFSYVLGTKK
jgi:hypothetical protein